MKSEQVLNLFCCEKKQMNTLQNCYNTARIGTNNRKTSIQLKDLSGGKKDSILIQKKQVAKPKAILQTCQSSKTLTNQKSDEHLKIKQSGVQRKSVKEIDGQQNLKQGDTYKSISPKVVINNDKINVYFVKEVSKYHINTETKSPKEETISTENTLILQEIQQQRVYLKTTQQQTTAPGNNQIFSNIPKSMLSNHKSFINQSTKKLQDNKIHK
ncbi:unnamed protein product (macronuclear) [Paramecium tetraurelia]|uniref:Uncharacterized protein n=1 Tax=Paramecium tetraurelia TaxID=5888 RepID=A0BXW4_PARTE|nr:uncharacterized protein GSPATT00033234001 [Paramecium tetraurelia]CAK63381.1 unnamed protein product [Paramecium tetraurelia]|eukprot:XP_001430779.1 hypothetical protein (macronuclear) [Paramecium tetraurelia strain d4-2]